MANTTPLIHSMSYRFPPATPYSPTFGLQITHLTDSYMLWVGIVPPSDADALEQAGPVPDPLRDEDGGGSAGGSGDAGGSLEGIARLGRDWAVGMPGRGNIPSVGTSLFRTGGEDLALSLAQRLARRFKKQVFLSVDVGELPGGGGLGGVEGARVMLEVERRIVQALDGLEKQEKR